MTKAANPTANLARDSKTEHADARWWVKVRAWSIGAAQDARHPATSPGAAGGSAVLSKAR